MSHNVAYDEFATMIQSEGKISKELGAQRDSIATALFKITTRNLLRSTAKCN